MTNIKKEIFELLKSINNNVSYSYPQDFIKLPVVTYEETNNYQINEFIDEVTFTINVWANTFAEIDLISLAIDELLTTKGFLRTSKIPLNDEQFKRVQMRYNAKINKNLYVGG